MRISTPREQANAIVAYRMLRLIDAAAPVNPNEGTTLYNRLPPDRQDFIDRLENGFEQAWKQGPPDVASFLLQVPETLLGIATYLLVYEDAFRRRRHGWSVTTYPATTARLKAVASKAAREGINDADLQLARQTT